MNPPPSVPLGAARSSRVEVRKVAQHAPGVPGRDVGSSVAGYLLQWPRPGHPMAIVSEHGTRRLLTTPVRRILQVADDGCLLVETARSTYRVTVR